VGANWQQLPVNRPRCPVTHYSRDASLATAKSYGGNPNYWPNSLAGAPEPAEEYKDPAWKLGEATVERFDSTVGHDDFTQAGNLYRLFDEARQERLAARIAGALGQAHKEVQMRQLAHFFATDEDYGRRVAAKLNIEWRRDATAAG
jgi:catalase